MASDETKLMLYNKKFSRKILFPRITVKDMFAMFKIRDSSIIYLHQSNAE